MTIIPGGDILRGFCIEQTGISVLQNEIQWDLPWEHQQELRQDLFVADAIVGVLSLLGFTEDWIPDGRFYGSFS